VDDDPDAVTPDPGVTAAAPVSRAAPATDGPAATPATAAPPTTAADDGPRGGFGRSRLRGFDGCAALLDHLRAVALERVSPSGLEPGGPFLVLYGAEASATTAGGAAGDDSARPASAAVHSGTTTQEAGVDEGDVVETDGSHVYVAGDDEVRIVEAADARAVERLRVPAGSHELLLDGTRLLVATRPWSGAEDTVVSIFDVTEPRDPTLVRRTHLEGRLVATRASGGIARLVLASSAHRLPFVAPDRFGLDEARALAANEEAIRTSSIEQWLPRWFEEGSDGTFGEMEASIDCTRIAAPDQFSGLGISWIASVPLHGDAPAAPGSAGIVSSGETVYASATDLYVATVPWDGAAQGPATTATAIHQFALEPGGGARHVASGEVPGHLLGQFAMSARAGDLRVAATTDATGPQGASESAVHVLRPVDGELVEIGGVGGLGRTEQIHAVRFLGDLAYVVTFRRTDPLYVVDLADPSAPVVRGELKIPGYSAYLHPVGDGLLLGVGQDATEDGRVLGTQLSLFDVRDPARPERVSTLAIGGASEAEWDHRAFLFWPEDGTIVIPVAPWWGPCAPEQRCLADQLLGQGGQGGGGVVVAELRDGALVARGVIGHGTGGGCWSQLQRSLVVGGELVTVGAGEVRFSDRATLVERDVARWDGGCGFVEG